MAKSFFGRADLPRGIRNNNPGNIRSGDDWKGEYAIDADGFVIFSDLSWGLRALAKDLITKSNRGLNTIQKIISEYAPASQNDVPKYVAFVSNEMGISGNTMLTFPRDLPGLIRGIVDRENGQPAYLVTNDDILEGIRLALNDSASVIKEAGDNPGTSIGLVLLLLAFGFAVFKRK